MNNKLKAGITLIGGATAAFLGLGKFLQHEILKAPSKRVWSDAAKQKDIFTLFGSAVETYDYTVEQHGKTPLRLQAKVIRQQNATHQNWAVLVHGYRMTSHSLRIEIAKFYEAGYHLLIPDLRGHGASEGKRISLGYYESFDVAGWIQHIILTEHPDAKIVLYGFSLGAGTVMQMAAIEAIKPHVVAIVANSGFTDGKSIMQYEMKRRYKMAGLYYSALNMVECLDDGFRLKDASAIQALKNNKIPLMIIHGALDEDVPVAMAFDLINATKGDKRLFILDEATHATIRRSNQTWAALFHFLADYV